MLIANNDEFGEISASLQKANETGLAEDLFQAHATLEFEKDVLSTNELSGKPDYLFKVKKGDLELSIPQASLTYLKEAAEKKHPEANSKLGDIYSQGNKFDNVLESYPENGIDGLDIEPDFDKALKYFLAAQKLGENVKNGLASTYKHFATLAADTVNNDLETAKNAHEKACIAMAALCQL